MSVSISSWAGCGLDISSALVLGYVDWLATRQQETLALHLLEIAAKYQAMPAAPFVLLRACCSMHAARCLLFRQCELAQYPSPDRLGYMQTLDLGVKLTLAALLSGNDISVQP